MIIDPLFSEKPTNLNNPTPITKVKEDFNGFRVEHPNIFNSFDHDDIHKDFGGKITIEKKFPTPTAFVPQSQIFKPVPSPQSQIFKPVTSPTSFPVQDFDLTFFNESYFHFESTVDDIKSVSQEMQTVVDGNIREGGDVPMMKIHDEELITNFPNFPKEEAWTKFHPSKMMDNPNKPRKERNPSPSDIKDFVKVQVKKPNNFVKQTRVPKVTKKPNYFKKTPKVPNTKKPNYFKNTPQVSKTKKPDHYIIVPSKNSPKPKRTTPTPSLSTSELFHGSRKPHEKHKNFKSTEMPFFNFTTATEGAKKSKPRKLNPKGKLLVFIIHALFF